MTICMCSSDKKYFYWVGKLNLIGVLLLKAPLTGSCSVGVVLKNSQNVSCQKVMVSLFLSASCCVSTLQRTTEAAEKLALHPPVVVAIVKPNQEETPVYFSVSIFKFDLNGRGTGRTYKRPAHPIWSPALMGLLEKKAILGKRRSWCMVNTLTAIALGSHK